MVLFLLVEVSALVLSSVIVEARRHRGNVSAPDLVLARALQNAVVEEGSELASSSFFYHFNCESRIYVMSGF